MKFEIRNKDGILNVLIWEETHLRSVDIKESQLDGLIFNYPKPIIQVFPGSNREVVWD